MLQKLVSGGDGRPSRLHTRDGVFCGSRELVGLLPAAGTWIRFKISGTMSVLPWWPYGAVKEFEYRLRPSDSVLEVGGGQSTLWLGERVSWVCAIEECPSWADTIRQNAQKRGLNNVKTISDESDAAFSRLLGEREWDVVIIDGASDRFGIFEALLRSTSSPRIVVYDDTDRNENDVENVEVPGYRKDVYRGFKPQTVYVCETTMFFREA